jgi:DNA (cytosine-5)-methyltransferase 1
VQAQPGAAIGPFHWKNRRLTFQELCRILTFPDNLAIGSGRTEMQRMLGNAVPSLLAEIMAREIRRQFFRSPLSTPSRCRRRGGLGSHGPSLCRRCQHNTGRSSVIHEAHPGTSKGRQAVKRVEERAA